MQLRSPAAAHTPLHTCRTCRADTSQQSFVSVTVQSGMLRRTFCIPTVAPMFTRGQLPVSWSRLAHMPLAYPAVHWHWKWPGWICGAVVESRHAAPLAQGASEHSSKSVQTCLSTGVVLSGYCVTRSPEAST